MSEVKHTGSDECSKMIDRIYAFHDHELCVAEADEIREHLLACEPCLDRFDVENAMRVVIRRCCSGEHAPDTLRLRVRTSFTRTVVITEEP